MHAACLLLCRTSCTLLGTSSSNPAFSVNADRRCPALASASSSGQCIGLSLGRGGVGASSGSSPARSLAVASPSSRAVSGGSLLGSDGPSSSAVSTGSAFSLSSSSTVGAEGCIGTFSAASCTFLASRSASSICSAVTCLLWWSTSCNVCSASVAGLSCWGSP